MLYRKHYIPLESNPTLFSELAHQLGLSTTLAFHDVLSIKDADLLSFNPRPAPALILVFPTSSSYKTHVAEEDKDIPNYQESGDEEEVVWYKQTINNACGLYGILHAVSNGDARELVGE